MKDAWRWLKERFKRSSIREALSLTEEGKLHPEHRHNPREDVHKPQRSYKQNGHHQPEVHNDRDKQHDRDDSSSKDIVNSPRHTCQHDMNSLNSSNCSNPLCSRRSRVFRPEKLHRPWMNLVVDLRLEVEEIEYICEETQPVRSSVNLDYQTMVPPLTMTWTHFVFLMLGLDVDQVFLLDLKDGDRLKIGDNLCLLISRKGTKWFVKVKAEGAVQECSFSVRNALAAVGTMLVEDPQQTLWLKPKHKRRYGLIDDYYSEDYIFDRSTPIDNLLHLVKDWHGYAHSRMNTLEASFTWAIYYHHYGREPGFNLSRHRGPERLAARFRSLCFILDIPEDERKKMLRSICDSDEQVENILEIVDFMREPHRPALYERQRLKKDLEILRAKFVELSTYHDTEGTEVSEWVAREMNDPSFHVRPHQKFFEDEDESVRRILSYLCAPQRFLPYIMAKASKENCERTWHPGPRFKRAKECDNMRVTFYKAMSNNPTGIDLLESFGRVWKCYATYSDGIDESTEKLKALMAHTFVLLTFWEDPGRVRWDGSKFANPEHCNDFLRPLELVLDIRDMATKAEFWLEKIIGTRPNDLDWFKALRDVQQGNVRGWSDPPPKPSGALDEGTIVEIAKRLQTPDSIRRQALLMNEISVWLKQLRSVYSAGDAEVETLFDQHKNTTVELT